jgi:hypothetical protein
MEQAIKDNKHCYNCDKTFKCPSDLIRHKNRKTPCLIQEIPDTDTGQDRCKFCNKAYKYHRSLIRHYKSCAIKNGGMEILAHKVNREEQIGHTNIIKCMFDLVKSQQEQMNRMEKKIQELSTSKNITTNSHNTQNIQQNYSMQNFVTINSYKSPSTEGLTLSSIDIDNHTKIAYSLIEKIYFNPDRPENHSIYLVNKKDKTLMVYIDKWHTLTSDNDRQMLIVELQNIIMQKGAAIVNGLYNNGQFLELPKDLATRIIAYNGGECTEIKMQEQKVLEYALKHKVMINDTKSKIK